MSIYELLLFEGISFCLFWVIIQPPNGDDEWVVKVESSTESQYRVGLEFYLILTTLRLK